jgi:chromosome segregation ATPase
LLFSNTEKTNVLIRLHEHIHRVNCNNGLISHLRETLTTLDNQIEEQDEIIRDLKNKIEDMKEEMLELRGNQGSKKRKVNQLSTPKSANAEDIRKAKEQEDLAVAQAISISLAVDTNNVRASGHVIDVEDEVDDQDEDEDETKSI